MYVKHFTFNELSQLRFGNEVEKNQVFNFSPNGKRFLTEAGLFHILNRSDKPNAYPFQKWVNTIVLPEIRQKGGYQLKKTHDLQKVAWFEKMMVAVETMQANQLAIKEDLQQMKTELLAVRKDQESMSEQMKLQQQATAGLSQRMYDFRLDIIRRNHDDSRVVQDKVQATSQAMIEKTAQNLSTLGKSVKKTTKRNAEGVVNAVDDLLSLTHAARQQLQLMLRLLQEREANAPLKELKVTKETKETKETKKIKKGYDAESKKMLREALLGVRERFAVSDQVFAEELNRNSVKTLTGQGKWTALKVKRFLGS